MADLIDRDKLVDYIMESDPDWCVKPIRPIFDFINGMPSAERHGKWLEHKDYPGLAYLCSECNWFTTDRSFYCPNCGTRMDGE